MLSLLALALQGAPISDSASLEFDMQCVTAVVAASQQDDAPAQALAPISTYYLGRVDARGSSDAEISAARQRATEAMEGASLGDILRACQGRMTEMGQRLQGIGSAGR